MYCTWYVVVVLEVFIQMVLGCDRFKMNEPTSAAGRVFWALAQVARPQEHKLR